MSHVEAMSIIFTHSDVGLTRLAKSRYSLCFNQAHHAHCTYVNCNIDNSPDYLKDIDPCFQSTSSKAFML